MYIRNIYSYSCLLPAVVVEDLAGDPRAGLAVDGVAEVLLGYAHQAGAHEDGDGDSVVELEHDVVDGEVVNLQECLETLDQVQCHDVFSLSKALQYRHGH